MVEREPLADKALILAATLVATEAHAWQVRPIPSVDGVHEPYINHVVAVAKMFRGRPVHEVVALLHDVVEDSEWTLEQLALAGFSPEIVEAVDSVTRRPGESYEAFVLRARANLIGREVKMADLAHNLSTLPQGDKWAARRRKYERALSTLAAPV